MDKNFGSNSNIKLHQDFPILIPYNLDLENHGQNILYRTTKDPITLMLIDQDISLALKNYKHHSKFVATEAIIVTFDNIPRYGKIKFYRFKYQVVIVTDYTNTFAILNYERLDVNGNEVGFSDPSCNYLKRFTTSSDKTVLTNTSNVGIPGKHISLLTWMTCK